jgi:hypothetical protein
MSIALILCTLDVPGRIVAAVVAELTVYGFWGREGREGRFAELLRKKGDELGDRRRITVPTSQPDTSRAAAWLSRS